MQQSHATGKRLNLKHLATVRHAGALFAIAVLSGPLEVWLQETTWAK